MPLCDMVVIEYRSYLPDSLCPERVPLIDQPVDAPLLTIDHAEHFLQLVRRCRLGSSGVIVNDRARVCFGLQLRDVQQAAGDLIVKDADVLKVSACHCQNLARAIPIATATIMRKMISAMIETMRLP